MKASIELSLRTREVYKLFERKISGNRLFIDAILHKINRVINSCHNQDLRALASYNQMEQKIINLTQQFSDEIVRFETLLSKKKNFESKKVNFVIQFRPSLIISNSLAMQLIQFIETYDQLVATLKLLHLAGCFETDGLYFGNICRYQKMANQALSTLVLTPITKVSRMKVQ